MCFTYLYYGLHAFNILVAVLSGVDFVIYNFAVFEVKNISSVQIVIS